MTAVASNGIGLLDHVRSIREGWPYLRYDPRPALPPGYAAPWARTEEFRLGYACFKREVARVLAPTGIIEIGVGISISALAFLNACPAALYLGIDNDAEGGRDFPVTPSAYVRGLLREHGY